MDASSSRWTICTGRSADRDIFWIWISERRGTEYMDRKREGKGRLSAARRRTDIEREG
jgi:hypothetical protein